MAMLRSEFKKLTPKQLKELIRLNLELIADAAPFKDTKATIVEIIKATASLDDIKALQPVLINAMQIVMYWDKHQSENYRFAPAEKLIVNEMLSEVKLAIKSGSNKENIDRNHMHPGK